MDWLRLNRVFAYPNNAANERVWQYHYQAPKYQYPWADSCWGVCWLLTAVTPPTGEKDRWRFEYNDELRPGAEPPGGQKATKDYELKGRLSISRMQYPTGGTVSYTYQSHLLNNSEIVIASKTADSDPSTPNVVDGVWEYLFPEPYSDSNREDLEKTVFLLPSGGKEIYDHDLPTISWFEGHLKEKVVKDVSGNVLLREQYDWDRVRFSDYFDNAYFDAFPGNHTYLKEKRIFRDGSANPYKTIYSGHDRLGNPDTIVEQDANISTQPDWQRTTTYTYFENTDKWIINRVEDEAVAGEVLPAHDRNFDQNTGNLLSDIQFGIGTTYTRNVYGEIETSMDGRGYVTEYHDYYRGLPKCVIKPVSIKDLTVNSSNCSVTESPQAYIKNTREIDLYGNVESFTNGRSYITGFGYDALNRLTGIIYPINDPVSIVWNANSGVLTRGVYQETTTYDGFGRETVKVNNQRSINKSYDALGNITEVYLPSQPNTIPVNCLGNHNCDRIEYDDLQRITTTTHSDNSIKTYDYLSLGKVRITDERGKTKLMSYRALGDLSASELMQIAADVGLNGFETIKQSTDIERDKLGHMTKVTQNGIQRVYQYNDNQLLEKIIEPELAYEEVVFAYDGAGNLESKKVGTNEATIYSSDGQNRRNGVNYPDYIPGGEFAESHDVALVYDENDNLESVDNGISQRTYLYDKNDNLDIESLTIDGYTFQVDYEYDALDYLQGKTYPISNRLVDFNPDPNGQPTILRFLDQPAQYKNIINAIDYWPNGIARKIEFSNGVYTCAFLDARQWVSDHYTYGTDYCGVVAGKPAYTEADSRLAAKESRERRANNRNTTKVSNHPYHDYIYRYDGVGNVTQIQDLKHGFTSSEFIYDGINRLLSITGHNLWHDSAFFYDLDGDIITASVGSSSEFSNVSYNYNTSTPSTNRLESIDLFGVNLPFGYDSHGNSIRDGRYRYQYDYANNLRIVFQLDEVHPHIDHLYAYDGNNQRIKKDDGGEITYFFYDHAGQLLGEYNGSGKWKKEFFHLGKTQVAEIFNKEANLNGGEQFILDGMTIRGGEYRAYEALNAITATNVTVKNGGTLLLKAPSISLGENFIVDEGGNLASGESVDLETGETITYLHADLLGSPRAASSPENTELWEEEYEPYGKRFLVEDSNSTWYTGKYEEDTGLLYYGARWYNPQIGRFYSLDPVMYKEENVHSFNRFAYANNNPYRFVDPDGRAAHIAIGAIVGAVVSGVSYAVTTDDFSWGDFSVEVGIGAVVGGATAAVPGAISVGALNFGSRGANFAVGVGNATAVGAVGNVVNQASKGNSVDPGEALVAGTTNAAGLVTGSALAKPAKSLATTTIKANPGLPVKSLRGNTFMVGKTPGVQYVDEGVQQTIQDLGGATLSTGMSEASNSDDD
jgi:RHS repeat-associated protein